MEKNGGVVARDGFDVLPGGFSEAAGRGTKGDTSDGMNKPLKSARRSNLTLGDLILAVSSSSHNSREATLAVMDLIRSRRVVLGGRHTRNPR